MSGTTFHFDGTDALKSALTSKAKMAAAKAIVKTNVTELAEGTQQRMAAAYAHTNPRTGKKYSTGTTMRSTKPQMIGDMKGKVAPGTEYFPYPEMGTRFMAAEPTLKPAFDAQKTRFVSDLRKLAK